MPVPGDRRATDRVGETWEPRYRVVGFPYYVLQRLQGKNQVEDVRETLQAALADRYKIERPIGRGGMATVFLANEQHPPREVAIKVLDPALGDKIGRSRFLREVEIVSQLTHPHVVPIFVAGEAEGLLYYVMPYIAGQSLRDKLAGMGTVPLDEAMHIAHDVADALSYAHGLGIVHRDIKPENILLSSNHALVTDFGIARALQTSSVPDQALTVAGLPIGTPGYMSPEQAMGGGEVDARSDIYSLAGVLYEMLTGKRPFTGISMDAANVPAGHGNGRDVPDVVREVLQRALAWNPEERFRTTADFAGALAQADTQHPHTAPRPTPSRPGEAPKKSIAVLPFANLSADPENEYFSDGITDDIITQLSKIGDLKVTSRTSAMRYKDTAKALRDVGMELGVATVLEGSVRRAGQRVRIVSQLIDVQTDAHLWAETYDRDLTDIFQIQSDVAEQIARALQATLSPVAEASINRKPTDDIEAYNLYLKGVHFSNKFTPDALEKALRSFEEAIALDPNLAIAYAGLANAFFTIGVGQGEGQLSPADAFQYAKEAARHALAIDDTIADAHATLGGTYAFYDWDWDEAEAAFNRANSLGCGCQEPLVKHAFYLAGRGRHDEAISNALKARELDPISLIVNTHLGIQYWWARRFDDATKQIKRTLELDAYFPPARTLLGWLYLQTGRVDEAVKQFEKIADGIGRGPLSVMALACAYAAAGREADANTILDQLQQQKASGEIYVSARDIGLVNAWLGNRTAALDWLDRAYEEHAAWMPYLNVDPVWDRVREEPRFQALVEKLDL